MSTIEQSKKMAEIAFKALDDKKGEDIRVIDISNVSMLADYFVIASGTNPSQVRALVDSVEHELESKGHFVQHREGYGLSNWTLLDFGDVIVNVFDSENRMFYNLEKIWSNGKELNTDEFDV